MPELPEVESVCRSLRGCVIGRRVVGVALRRADIVVGEASPAALLAGQTITAIARHGKQMALVGGVPRRAVTAQAAGPACVCVHLGMTGSLRYYAAGDPAGRDETDSPGAPLAMAARHRHRHLVWRLDDGGSLVFRDPRRFGGVWTYPSLAAVREARWRELGPDAMSIRPRALRDALGGSARPIKSALLDQRVVAGLGNIYVDELLFVCGVSPLARADSIGPERVGELVRCLRTLLTRAIGAGGSTLRDYVNGFGAAGGFQLRHQVYGRSGQPCVRCGAVLATIQVAGRTTVYCPKCQPHSHAGRTHRKTLLAPSSNRKKKVSSSS